MSKLVEKGQADTYYIVTNMGIDGLCLFASYKSQAEDSGVMDLLDSYRASAGTDTILGRSSALTRANCDVPARTAAAQADMPFTC